MSFTMYDLSIPMLRRGLTIVSEYLEKAEEYAATNNINPTVLFNARLAPDMLPLSAQVQRISDNSKGAIGRLAAVDVPSFADTETTFKELKARIENTDAFLASITPQHMEGSDSRLLELKFRSFSGILRGQDYLTSFLLPNFFFHITTLHNILRHNGMNIGKVDYLGRFNWHAENGESA